jgi:hypothetical protein
LLALPYNTAQQPYLETHAPLLNDKITDALKGHADRSLLLIIKGMVVRRLVSTWAAGSSWTTIGDILWLAAKINCKSLIAMLLVEVIRGSILRVREHYADARANTWMGRAAPLLTLLRQAPREADPLKWRTGLGRGHGTSFACILPRSTRPTRTAVRR